MLALVTTDAAADMQADAVDVLVGLLREHETVLLVDGVDSAARCRLLVGTLRARLPRARFLVLVADLPAGPDLDLVGDLLEVGAVPLIAVPDGDSADAVRAMLVARLRPDAVLPLIVDADRPVGVTVLARTTVASRSSLPESDQGRRRLQPVAAGWCSRPDWRACPRSATEGCYGCSDLDSGPEFLAVHVDVAARAHALAAQARASGAHATAVANQQLADAADGLIATISSPETRP